MTTREPFVSSITTAGGDNLNEAHERLASAEACYRSLIESIPAITYIDAPGEPWTTLFMSPQVEALLGFTPAEMTGPGSKWAGRVHPEDRDRVLAASVHHLATGESLAGDYRMIARDGSIVWVSRQAEVVRDESGVPLCSQGVIFDITERKRMEERLRLLESVVVNSNDSVMVTEAHRDGSTESPRIVYVNHGFTELTGYPAEEAVGATPEILRGGKTDRAEIARMDDLLASGLPAVAELVNYKKDGTEYWVNASVTPVFDEDGQCTHYVSIQREVTERRREEDRFRALVQNASGMIWIIASDATIGYVGPSVTRVLGYAPEELAGTNCLELVHPDDADDMQRKLTQLLKAADTTLRGEVRMRHKDGTWRHLEIISTNLLDDPSVEGIVVNGRDVTERKESERVLRIADQRFRGAFDNAPIGMAIVGPEGRFLQVNPPLRRMLGRSAAEMQELTFADITHPDDVEISLANMRDLLSGSRNVSVQSKRYVAKDGAVVDAETHVTLIRSDAGDPLYFVAQIVDVTGRARLEEHLRQTQKMEAVGQLAGGIAHDFNNLLSVIQSYARFVMESLRHGDEARADAEEIVKAGERAASLVRQLLAFSRRDVTHAAVLNVNTVLSDMEMLLRRTIGEDIGLTIKGADDLGGIKMDPAQLEQIVMNMVVNARDAMPRGGRLHITTANGMMDVGTGGEAQQRCVRLIVADTGRGMSPEHVSRIFEPFFTTKPRGRGTGLGLATVYAIVQQVGGTISVESESGKGTSFEMCLPAVDLASEADVYRAPGREVRGGKETVLVAEDEDAVRRLVVRILTRNGYNVISADDGTSALRLFDARRGDVDLVITDVVMPHMSGRDLADAVHSRGTEAKILFMSGYPGEKLAQHGIFQAEGYIQKPFTAEELLAMIRETLDDRVGAAAS